MRTSAGLIALLATALVLASPSFPAETTKTLWSKTSFGAGDYFHEPADIEVDGARSLIYVVDAGSCRVLVFDSQGEFLRAVGQKGQGPGEFLRPTGMCLVRAGGFAVADFGSNRIQTFDAAGTFVRSVAVKQARVADLVFDDGRFFTVPAFSVSGYSVTLDSQDKGQPLVNVLDEEGQKTAEISVADFPEAQPFIRAIKHRVSLAVSPHGKLYLPFYSMNLVQVFDKTGKKVASFTRPLAFKPVTPALIGQRSPEKGIVQMRATNDIVNAAAKFGPDGKLYILTAVESLAESVKQKPDVRPALPMRLDVIDPETHQVVRTIPCAAGVRAFGLLDGGRLVYIYEDAEGELTFTCVRY
jgi:DNA-binding beta-propeller fold protein YncE